MSNINTIGYYDFSIKDYTGSTTTLSSYNLDTTPVQFVPIESSTVDTSTRFVWATGDGTFLDEYSPTYTYKKPGLYTVTLTVYKSDLGAARSSVTKSVLIKDYLEDNFFVDCSSLNLTAGRLSSPLTITQTLPIRLFTREEQVVPTAERKPVGFLPKSFQTKKVVVPIDTPPPETILLDPASDELKRVSTIQYSVSGCNSVNYFFLPENLYNHLEQYNSLFSRTYVDSISTYDIQPISNIQLPLTAVYTELSSGQLVESYEYSENKELVGYRGYGTVYYRDDVPVQLFNIAFTRNSDGVSNALNVTLSGSVETNTPTKIVITSNGITGDGYPNSIFNIDKNKFANTNIHFVACLTDADGNKVKNAGSILYPGDITFELIGNNVQSTSYSISSLQSTLSSLSAGGYFRGYLTYTGTLSSPLTSVYLSAAYLDTLNTELGEIITTEDLLPLTIESELSAVSSTFNIYPSNYYKFVKINEDFDSEQMFESLIFQETLMDKPMFFEEFLGTIFGDDSVDIEALGNKLYERISNFINNNTNINTNEILNLLSLADLMQNNATVFDKNLFNFPNKIQRVISLIAVNRDKLFGIKNTFAENFNDFGTTTKEVYGKNLGDQIDTTSYTITAGTDIVAYEKFSKIYKLLNTYQPLCAASPTTLQYKLSDYSSNWGWPLVLPQDTSLQSINTYYDFYEYNSQEAGDIVGGILNFTHTTVPFDTPNTQLIEQSGIYENIILDTLYQSLSLTK
jgi:PKD repeat protein